MNNLNVYNTGAGNITINNNYQKSNNNNDRPN